MRVVLRLLLVVGLSLGLLLDSATILADEGIVVKSNTHANFYPKSISFQLNAESTADITRVKLNYRVLGNAANNYAYPEGFRPGEQVDVKYELNTQKSYLPPEVEIRYYWEIEDAAGQRLRTEPVTFAVTDTRFQWKRIEEGNIVLLWYQGTEDFARELVSSATGALEQLSRDAGIKPKQRVKILAYASQADMLGALEPGAHEWTGGRSFSSESIVVIAITPNASGREFARRAIPHELSHVVIHQATDNPYGGIPQWLNEGLAMYAEGSPEDTYREVLDRAIRDNALLSLKTLSSNFPADPQQATLSYAESYSVVKFILDRYGREKMAKLLAVFAEGSTYDAAAKAALGVTVDELEREWRASLGLATADPQARSTAPLGVTPVPGRPSSAPSDAPPKQSQPCGALPLAVIAVTAILAKRYRL